jgi:hypothetical protein
MFYLFAILTFFIAYQRARAVRRSGVLWGGVTALLFMITGQTVAFAFTFLAGFGGEVWNWSAVTMDYVTVAGLVLAGILSFVASAAVFRYLGRP